MSHCLLIEAYNSGSHKQLVDLLVEEFSGIDLVTLPGKKWHWKARTAALYLSQNIQKNHSYRILFSSSVLNLAELVALRPDLVPVQKILYFHENQLVYPVRGQKDRDFQYGYNQILSCLVADVVLFNSQYNMDSFLTNINTFLKLIPDHRPRLLSEQIRPKCRILYFPIVFPSKSLLQDSQSEAQPSCKRAKIQTDSISSSDNILCTSNTEESHFSCTAEQTQMKNSSCFTDGSDVKIYQNVTGFCNDSLSVKQEIHTNMLSKDDCITESKINLTNDVLECVPMDGSSEHDQDDLKEDSVSSLGHSGALNKTQPLHIVWPHRWEHDKGPDLFLQTVQRLHNEGLNFQLSVIGETYTDVPVIFEDTRRMLGKKIQNWGYQPSKKDYFKVLESSDCVVSTALHEFFGVAMLEAVHLGCYPLCPNRLVYPEIFPKECLYNTDQQLYKRLRHYCRNPQLLRNNSFQFSTAKFSWDALKDEFRQYLQ